MSSHGNFLYEYMYHDICKNSDFFKNLYWDLWYGL